jgi:ROS/MUCR transcriptional regulator protein
MKKISQEMKDKMVSAETAGKQLKEKSRYSASKGDYKDKIIDYPYSPTGKAYIGINKRPLMKVKDGYGFQGVLTQDDERRFVQCHICGKWAKVITHKHVFNRHGLTMDEYKEKFGLFRSKGLVSDETSANLTANVLKAKDYITMHKRFKGICGRKKSEGSKKLAYRNRFGTCPAQLRARLYEFINTNKELPGRSNKGKQLYQLLARRYGGFGIALSKFGLPNFKRQGTNYVYTFPDYTVYKYNLNIPHDRNKLYNMMVEKCPELTTQINNEM